ncbi:MAG: hypothetical protein IVW51_11105 [Thermaceae bacterium]|nr:hypothetical protein [Thermaceae bacterium]
MDAATANRLFTSGKNVVIASQGLPNDVSLNSLTAFAVGIDLVPVPVFKHVTPRGALRGVPNQTQLKDRVIKGANILVSLKDSSNVEIPGSTGICIGVRAPNGEFIKWVRRLPYANWYGLTVNQQQSEDILATLAAKTDLGTEGLILPEQSELYVGVQTLTSITISWANSFLSFQLAKELS